MLELDSMKPYHDFVKSIEDSKAFTKKQKAMVETVIDRYADGR